MIPNSPLPTHSQLYVITEDAHGICVQSEQHQSARAGRALFLRACVRGLVSLTVSRHVLTLNVLDPQPERSGGVQRHPLVVGESVDEGRESGGERKGLAHDSVVAEGSVAGGWGLRRTAGRARTARAKEPPPVMFNICSSVIDKTTAPWQACQ